ncbi:MAG: RsmB/NOP family class I SAM-dependent RNA methyltransferase [Parasphingorhabdus sp.]
MRPAARLQAAIELLDEIIMAARDDGASADAIIKRYFKKRRYAGSKDRRAIRDHVYAAIRLFGDRPESGRSAMLGLVNKKPELQVLFDGSDYGPSKIGLKENGADGSLIPKWIQPKFADVIDEIEQDALLGRADLHIRVKPQYIEEQGVVTLLSEAKTLPLGNAYALPNGTRVEGSQPYRGGQIEIQDLGSQAIVAAGAQQKPKLVLDLCAGAGGKTMGLAAQLPDSTRMIASDTDRGRLSRMKPRMERAGADNIETILLHPNREWEALQHLKNQCDLVIVDAPCSGTGTWRRNPELRWRMTPKRLQKTTELQQRLLQLGSEFVAEGGRLLFAVCSLLDDEGPDQVEKFLQSEPDWRDIEVDLPLGRPYRKGLLLSPYHDGTDGFYFSCLEKL